MSAAFEPSYQKTLRKVRDALGMERVLAPIWRRRSRWPTGDRKMIYICDAFDRVGRTKYGKSWTGNEFGAYRSVHAFHDFAQTLADFREEIGEWQSRYHGPLGDRRKTSTSSTPRSMLAGGGSKSSPSSRPQRTRTEIITELQEASRRNVEELETWGKGYRSQYDAALAEWKTFAGENAAAVERLTWVINWVVGRARDGDVQTALRRVDTADAPGPYRPAPDGFWNVENVVETRIREGRLDFEDSCGEDSRADTTNGQRVYIFFDRESFDQSLLTMASPGELITELSDIHLSAFMRLAIAVIREEGLTPSFQSKKDSVLNTVYRLAPQFGIETQNRQQLFKYLASIVREPESQLGRQKKMGQTQNNV